MAADTKRIPAVTFRGKLVQRLACREREAQELSSAVDELPGGNICRAAQLLGGQRAGLIFDKQQLRCAAG